MLRDLSKVLHELWRASGGRNTYRPDLHYMRGPGPKWHAKYGTIVATTPQTNAPSAGTLRDGAERRA